MPHRTACPARLSSSPRAGSGPRPVTLLSVALLAVAVTLGLLTAPAAPAAASGAIEQFRAGQSYRGTFADPTVMRVGDQYVAAATTTANLNLPMMTSPDLRTWTPRPALTNYSDFSSWRLYNDSMPVKARWAATARTREKVAVMSQWAPSIAKVGKRYLAAYSAAVRLEPRHSCIGIATSTTPLGVYLDRRKKPLVCFKRAPLGAIDPEIFLHPKSGKPFLLWKQEGIPQVQRPMLMGRRLNAAGTRFKKGSKKKELLTRDQAWEGAVVENPSMVFHAGRYYLFYSGNAWATGDYATGYAICERPLGPCAKPADRPLLDSGDGVAGTGGADAIVDESGALRLVYAAWDEGRVGPVNDHRRRMHVATVEAEPTGELRLTARR